MIYDTLFINATIVDGTGREPYKADVAIKGDRIVSIGQLGDTASADMANANVANNNITSTNVIEASGLCLAPGFIDVHTHDDKNVIQAPEMLPKLSQGITTVIVGNCGISLSPVTIQGEVPDPMNLLGEAGDFLYPSFAEYAQAVDEATPSVNVAALVGHTSLRSQVMDSFSRQAAPSETEQMQALLSQALREGAIGLSSGLAYRNAMQAPEEELSALVSEVNHAGGIYTTHLRDEGPDLLGAMDEAIRTAKRGEVPLVISHLKCAGAGNWGKSSVALETLEAAAEEMQACCDCYPYSAGSTTLDTTRVTDDCEITITWSDPHPEQARRTLQAIANDWNLSIFDAAIRLQPAGAIYHNMDEKDVQRILSHPLSMIGSDGLPNDPHPHPRLWGTFPRVLGHYSRDLGLLALHEAVRKMSGFSASTFGLTDRGVIREGAFADLTLFDPDSVIDTANYDTPISISAGIELVMVNGHISYQHGEATGIRAGRMLRRTGRIQSIDKSTDKSVDKSTD